MSRAALHRGLLSLYGTDEPKPAAVNRLDESGMAGVVAKGLPKLADRLSQSVLGHRDIGPDRVEQLLVRHQLAGALQKIRKDRVRLGT